MNTVVIGMGSNINPEQNFRDAKERISTALKLINSSRPKYTKPFGFADQDDFLNCVLIIETEKEKEEVIRILKSIESSLGRERTTNKDGPRTIDLDILVWNNEVIDSDVYSRNFLKDSILELIPGFKF